MKKVRILSFLTVFLAILFLSPTIVDVYAEPIFSCGFDPEGDFSDWTGTAGLISIDNTVFHHGTYSAKASSQAFCTKTFALTYPEAYMRTYVRWSSTPDENSRQRCIMFGTASQPYRAVVSYNHYIGEDPKWAVRLNDADAGSYTANIAVDTWYCVELYCKISDTVGELRVWIDGTERITVTDLNTGLEEISKCYCIWEGVTWVPTTYWDCVVVDTSYIGPEVSNAYITVNSNPVGSGLIEVDETPITTPEIYEWEIGSSHNLTAISPSNLTVGQYRYVFNQWSNGSTSQTIIVHVTANATFTANFTKQYYLNLTTSLEGSMVNQTNADGWYNTGASATINATFGEFWAEFHYWYWKKGGVTQTNSTQNPKTITMNNYVYACAYWGSPPSDQSIGSLALIIAFVAIALYSLSTIPYRR